MIDAEIHLESDQELMPLMKGKVFHVTTATNFAHIKKSNTIIPNPNSERASPFGNYKNGFFKLKGCVSFFDYRDYGSDDWEANAYKCTPSQILHKAECISILVLSEEYYDKLITWEDWKTEEKWSHMIVPHIEVGYPGPVKLEFLTEHLVVRLKSIN